MRYPLSLVFGLFATGALAGPFDRDPSAIRADLEAFLAKNKMPYELSEQSCKEREDRKICSFDVENKTDFVVEGKVGSNTISRITISIRERRSGNWPMWGGMAISMIRMCSPSTGDEKARKLWGELFRNATDEPSEGVTVDGVNYSASKYSHKDMDFFIQPR